MVLGTGIDLIEIERVGKACQKEAFLSRCYTGEEIKRFKDSPSCLAGNFAVKESVAKALGTGFSGFSPRDIEVLRDPLGAPYVNLYGKARERMEQLGIEKIHVSITNTKELAAAFAVAEGRTENM